MRFASFLGDNAFEFYRQVVACLGETLAEPAELLADTGPGMDALFESGRLDVAFGCGLTYVWRAAEPDAPLELLAAPVMPGERYADRPIYFSDLIVRADSAFGSLDDLRGASFAYNQAVSFSGYVLPLYHFHEMGLAHGFFGAVTASGSHAASMDWVEGGRADAAAIDSVVLDMELRQRPERAGRFRVVASFGPAGMPPAMAATRLDGPVRAALREALCGLHTTPRGRAILQAGGVRRFAPVTDRDYDGIRAILRHLERAGVSELR